MLTKRLILPIFAIVFTTSYSLGQKTYDLWETGKAPFYKANDLEEYKKELWGTECTFNITQPTITVYPAKGDNTGRAIIVVPGGGYELVAQQHEGHDVARVLSDAGVTAIVLKYRLPLVDATTEPQHVPLTDLRRALEMTHSMADEYGVRKESIGVLGFSAGSHLATVASLWPGTKPEHRVAFSVLIYGVTEFTEENQNWLEKSLYHRELTQQEIEAETLLNHVSADTPPAFLVHAYDDDICPVEESTLYAEALRANGVQRPFLVFPAWFGAAVHEKGAQYFKDHGFAPAGHMQFDPGRNWRDLPPERL